MQVPRQAAIPLMLLVAWATTPLAHTPASQTEDPAVTEKAPSPGIKAPSSPLEAAERAVDRVAGEGTAEMVENAVGNAVVGTLQAASAGVVQDKTLVLRISREFIREHVPQVAAQVNPVDRCLFGAHVHGTAVTNGAPRVVEGSDPASPSFTMHFQGHTRTDTVATKGPVRARTKGEAMFDVRRDILFDASGFHASDTAIDCDFTSSLAGLGTPPGVRGRVVRRIAMPQIEKTQPVANTVSLNQVKAEVLKAFNDQTDDLVSSLNRRLPWKATLAIVAPNGTERVRKMSTTPVYLEIRSHVVDSDVPDLPIESDDLRAPIELWVLGEPSPFVAAELMALWGLSKMALPAASPGDQSPPLTEDPAPSQPAAHGFEPELLGEWWVMRLGADLMEQFFDAPATPDSGTDS